MHIPAIKENLGFANSVLLKNLYGKLGVSSRKELYAIASQLPPEYTQLKL